MGNGERFLENIQGLLLYLKAKNGTDVSISGLLEKDESTFNYLLEDYNENHLIVLKSYFNGKRKKLEHFIHSTAIESLKHYEKYSKEITKEGTIEELNKIKEYQSNLISNIPTKYQEYDSFGTVNHLLEELIKAAERLGMKIDIIPVIGTVSTFSVNACTLTLETGEPIIIVDVDILSFIHLFSKIFIQCLSIESENDESIFIKATKEDIIANIKQKPEILVRFKDLMTSYVIEGSPRKSEQYYLEKDSRYWICTYLIMSAELFLVGHELGHIMAKHNTTKRKFGFYNGEAIVGYESKNWMKEFEADIYGKYLSMQALANMGFQVDFCYIGIEPFFVVYDIAMKARKILKEGNEDITSDFHSHPPNSLRIENTRNELRGKTKEDDYLNATHIPDLFKETMEYLWEQSKDVFYSAYGSKNGN